MALTESLDALIRLRGSQGGPQSMTNADALLASARVSGLAFSTVAKRAAVEGADSEALALAETEFTEALEAAIQATKASLSAELQVRSLSVDTHTHTPRKV